MKESSMRHPHVLLTLAALALAPQMTRATTDAATARAETGAILAAAARESGRSAYSPERAIVFPDAYNVYLASTLAIDFTYRDASAKLPLYRGLDPDGGDAFYVLTEASDAAVAEALGLIHAPKLAAAAGSDGTQRVTLEDGIMRFEGAVDFSPVREIAPGAESPFPPAAATPGAVADDAWSSIVELPSGVVLNAQVVANASGLHDRAVAVNTTVYTATLSLLDGFADDRQYFYHLVTDVSADVPAALENGVYAPRLGLLPTFGDSGEDSALLGFSPILHGISDVSTGEDQGFGALLANGGIDPINVFPYGPEDPNYSPLWDAHVSQWTEAAIEAGEVRRITSFDDLAGLIEAGLVESAFINPEGEGNDWLYGLRPTRVVINCPVIAHPDPRVVVR
jgi:hypothetical protein